MMQAFGMGYVNSLSEIRQIIGNSFNISIFQPKDNLKWEKAFNSYRQAIKLSK
jgi:rhamnulokinase